MPPQPNRAGRLVTLADFQEHIITGDAALRTYLGDTAATDPQNQTRTGHLATKADPRCRFM